VKEALQEMIELPRSVRRFKPEPIASKVLSSEDYFVVFPGEQDILSLQPDIEKLKRHDLRDVVVTAERNHADFVSRFFAPKFGIDEDPVTGSAHCALTPYWAKRISSLIRSHKGVVV